MSAREGRGWSVYVRAPAAALLYTALGTLGSGSMAAQESSTPTAEQRAERLAAAVAKTEAELQASQEEIRALRRDLDVLREQLEREHAMHGQAGGESTSAGVYGPQAAQPTPETTASAEPAATRETGEAGEREVLQEAQIATLDQSKVESESKYPIKLSGLVLLTGYTNTAGVDIPSTPTFAMGGSGSTGASVRQTILGLDARGPHLLGARSNADVRVDFAASTSGLDYGGESGIARLRTAHAALRWSRTEAFFVLDRPLFNPNTPASLTAVAEPALAWSGNLWRWIPQAGVTQDLPLGGPRQLRVQAAVMDVADSLSPAASSTTPGSTVQPSLAERSRWPGVETRVALLGSSSEHATEIGVGGYFSPHTTMRGTRFNAWATTLDLRLPLPLRFELTGSGYRGQALGGLGGGGYKDYTFRVGPTGVSVQALNDAGGWTQLKQRLGQRLEWNAAFGIDNVFAGQLRPYASTDEAPYQNLARNRTATGNVIYSPSAYLLFSFEYRHLESAPVIGPGYGANIFGIAAGYKF